VLTVRDLAWAAGFLDGEGSFSLLAPKTPHGGVSPKLQAAQVDRELLDRLRRMFGGAIYLRRYNPPRPRIHDCHLWALNGKPAIGVMLTLYPMLSLKRRLQIQRVVAAWRSAPGKGSYNRTKTHCKRGHPFDATNTYIEKRADGRFRIRRCLTCRPLRTARVLTFPGASA
jgi:hypothetical protein